MLILTKPIGTSAIQAASRVGMATDYQIKESEKSMACLNDVACQILMDYEPTGGTDVTGFGLAGHCYRLALASNVSIELNFSKIPLFDGVVDIYKDGCIPGATFRNKEFLGANIHFSDKMSYEDKMILFDAQTSGGLLFGIDSDVADVALKRLKSKSLQAEIVGKVLPFERSRLYVK